MTFQHTRRLAFAARRLQRLVRLTNYHPEGVSGVSIFFQALVVGETYSRKYQFGSK